MSLAITLALVALAVTSTFSAGLELLRGRDRRAVVGLLLVNVALVPALAWLLLQIFDPERSVHRAGGSSPSPLVERARPLLARSAGGAPTTTGVGFVALAVASAVLVPLGLALLGTPVPLWRLLGLIAIQLAPLVAGAAVARRLEAPGALAARLRTVGNALLVAVVGLLALDRGPSLTALGLSTAGMLGGLVGLTAVAGAVAGRPRAPLALLTVVRNLTLALLLCETLEPGGLPTLIVATYGLLMYAAAGVLLLFARRVARDGDEAAQES